jgi:hypothetical protein
VNRKGRASARNSARRSIRSDVEISNTQNGRLCGIKSEARFSFKSSTVLRATLVNRRGPEHYGSGPVETGSGWHVGSGLGRHYTGSCRRLV